MAGVRLDRNKDMHHAKTKIRSTFSDYCHHLRSLDSPEIRLAIVFDKFRHHWAAVSSVETGLRAYQPG
jgi:hypothetical protein